MSTLGKFLMTVINKNYVLIAKNLIVISFRNFQSFPKSVILGRVGLPETHIIFIWLNVVVKCI